MQLRHAEVGREMAPLLPPAPHLASATRSARRDPRAGPGHPGLRRCRRTRGEFPLSPGILGLGLSPPALLVGFFPITQTGQGDILG